MKEVRTSQLKGIIEPLVVKGYKVWLFFATGNGDAFRNRPLFQGASPDVVREWITSEWNSTDGEGYIQAIQFEVYEDRAAVPQHYRQHCDWKSVMIVVVRVRQQKRGNGGVTSIECGVPNRHFATH